MRDRIIQRKYKNNSYNGVEQKNINIGFGHNQNGLGFGDKKSLNSGPMTENANTANNMSDAQNSHFFIEIRY